MKSINEKCASELEKRIDRVRILAEDDKISMPVFYALSEYDSDLDECFVLDDFNASLRQMVKDRDVEKKHADFIRHG